MHLQLSCFVLSVLVSLISDVMQRGAEVSSVPAAAATSPSTARHFGFSPEGTDWVRRQPVSHQWHFTAGGVRGGDVGEGGSWLTPSEGSRHAVLSSGGAMRRVVHLEGGQHVLTLHVTRRGTRSAPLALQVDDALITTWTVGGAGRVEALVALVAGGGNRVLTLINPEGAAAVAIDRVELSQLVTGAQVLSDGFEREDEGEEWLAVRAGLRRAAPKSDGSWLTSRHGEVFAFVEAGGVLERTVLFETGVQQLRLTVARPSGASSPSLTVFIGQQKLGDVVPTSEGFARVSLPPLWMESGEAVVRVVNAANGGEVFVDELSIEAESSAPGAPQWALVRR